MRHRGNVVWWRSSNSLSNSNSSTHSLKSLARLLNSPSLRDLRPINYVPQEEQARVQRRRRNSKELVEHRLRLDSHLSMSELTMVKPLGEGAFAVVELYSYSPIAEGSSDDGPFGLSRGSLVALKRMRQCIPDPRPPPPGQECGPVRMISVPESWRLTFQSEALLLKALRHPNVVACYGCVQPADGQRLFSASDEELIFAQEYCEGGTLLDRVRRPRSYSAEQGLRWVAEVASGMRYLHSRDGLRVTHRDLKLENVLLSMEGVAKVADFGLSRLLLVGDQSPQDAEPGTEPGAELGTEPGTELGTELGTAPPPAFSRSDMTGQTGSCRYMAPEVYLNRSYDHRVDVFSFSVLAYEVLARRRAYDTLLLTMDQVAKAVAASGLRPPLPKRWPPSLSSLIARCWAQDPEERPEFEAVADELYAMLAEVEAATAAGTPSELLKALEPEPALAGCCVLQ
jgi:serine/threonine protein kinase